MLKNKIKNLENSKKKIESLINIGKELNCGNEKKIFITNKNNDFWFLIEKEKSWSIGK